MRCTIECLPCLIRQAVIAAAEATDDRAQREQIVRDSLRLAADADLIHTPPFLAGGIYRLITEITGNADPYKPKKDLSNRQALALYPGLQQQVAAAADPFETALRMAIAGNIIDFGIPDMAADACLETTIRHAMDAPLDAAAIDMLRRAAANAEEILYLGDNAGEIVLDKLFIEQLPAGKVTYAVRGRPIINDVTMDDAETVGLTDLVRVISNGTGYPGTVREHCSPAFQAALARADLVIAKGQGNYETLEAPEKTVFYLLKVKCAVVSRQLNRALGDVILLPAGAA